MMQLQLYDPNPIRHEFVSKMYYEPMWEYARDNGIDLTRIDELIPSSGKGVICDADYLTPEKIRWFKENQCELYAFSCIDSAYLSETIRYATEMLLINRIFMVSGVPNTNHSRATVIEDGFGITAQQRQFLPEETWNNFNFMRERRAIQSLPYPIWNRVAVPPIKPFAERRPTVLFRGGGHFLRVLAFFEADRLGIADKESGFLLHYYFNEGMNPKFRYCDDCREKFRNNGGRYPISTGRKTEACTSPAEWGGETVSIPNTGVWNNKCPRSWMWLAQKFSDRHGALDMQRVADALNFKGQDEVSHRQTIADVRFYADVKWEFSIYAAQRFWEAASVGTINLLPKRANDQDYFPPMKDGEHYLTFSDDLSGMTKDIDRETFDRISGNAFELWQKWMSPSRYKISTNLLKHIFDTIFTPRNT